MVTKVRRSVSMARSVALVATAALVLSACYRPMALHIQETAPHTRPWWCDSKLDPNEHGVHYYLDRGMTKAPLSWDDCITLSGDLDAAVAYAMQWPTRGAAEAAGWTPYADYATGMGTHHALGSPLQSTFDPRKPTFLQFDGNTPDAKLVGMSWYVGTNTGEPPSGFVGGNDWWHAHEYLCMSNQTGKVIFDGPCPPGTSGNTFYLGNYWMVHAWVIPGYTHEPDVFTGHHPCLLPSGPAPAGDDCWTMGTPHTGH